MKCSVFKPVMTLLVASMLLLHLGACTKGQASPEEPQIAWERVLAESPPDTNRVEHDGILAVTITIGERAFAAEFYDNASARAIADQMPFTLTMSDYGAQEKVADLSVDLPAADTENPPTIRAGELYLWSGDSLVFFYTTFANSYSGYVPIGTLSDPTGLVEALGSGDATVTFSLRTD